MTTITVPRVVLEQALEALSFSCPAPHLMSKHAAAEAALRAALAQDKQEWTGIPGTNVRVKVQPPLMWGGRLIPQTDTPTVPRGVFYTPPECKQKEQEPVAWMCSNPELMAKGYERFASRCEGDWNIPVYTSPPQRQPLTDEVAALTAQRDALLEALKDIAGTDPVDAALDPQRAVRIARAAIKAVEGTK